MSEVISETIELVKIVGTVWGVRYVGRFPKTFGRFALNLFTNHRDCYSDKFLGIAEYQEERLRTCMIHMHTTSEEDVIQYVAWIDDDWRLTRHALVDGLD